MALTPTRIKPVEYDRTAHAVNPPPGTEFEEVLDPRYWAHLAARLAVGDILEVKPDDMRWWAQLIVTQTDLVQAHVVVLTGPVKLDGVQAAEPALDDHTLKFAGGRMRWCVVRMSDREYVFQGGTRDEAVAWMEDRAAKVAAARLKQAAPEPKPEAVAETVQEDEAETGAADEEEEEESETAQPRGRRRRRAEAA